MLIPEIHKKLQKIFFDFEIVASELVALKTRFIEREYLSSGVNDLTSSFKISDTTKTEFFELIFLESDQKIWQKYRRANWSSFLVHLTCWMSISVLTWGFLGIWVTWLFAVYNFRNKSAVRLIFYFEVFKILCRFSKYRKISSKFFSIWR